MLKIKDNVDLKELEKFGFVYSEEMNEYRYISAQQFEFVCVSLDDKHISCEDFSGFDIFEGSLDILFDLIQAGLVEKVEEQDGNQ